MGLKITCSTYLLFLFLSCSGQKGGFPFSKLIGRYKKINGNEIIVLKKDKTFVCLRNYVQKSDGIFPLCDTLAEGLWSKKETFIALQNKINFNTISYSVTESNFGSKDSIYFKIILPADDALDYKIFKFSVVTSPMYGIYNEFEKPEFAFVKKGEGVAYAVSLKNIAPNCDMGVKCYQRIYFNVFEGYIPKNTRANLFTITLENFNQCFYEMMDIEGDVVGTIGKTLFWRGNQYKKIE